MSREFYVFKIGKKEDTSKGRKTWGEGGNNTRLAPRAARFAEAVRPRQNGDGLDLEDEAPQAVAVEDIGYGYYLQRADCKDMDMAFSSAEAAERYAREQAELCPKTLFGVFSCDKVFETTTPAIIEKKYNDAGELLVVTK